MESRYVVPYPRIGSVFGAAERDVITTLLDNAPTLTQGEWREKFEQRFRHYAGTKYAVTVTSGTVALALAIHLLDLRPGDEVIATPQTYQATVQPLLDRDVRVRFCDVDPVTLNADPADVARRITARTRAIILVHYGGLPAAMDEVRALAEENDILVLEDCAHALGASRHGRRPGGLGDLGCFSFHSAKNITTLGEGGMITFDRDDWWHRLDRLRSNEVDGDFTERARDGAEPGALRWMRDVGGAYTVDCRRVRRAGTNAAMSEAAAAFGYVQMGRLPALAARRRAIATQLNEVLGQRDDVVPQQTDEPGHAYHFYTFHLTAPQPARDELLARLDAAGVEVQLRYFPLHLRPEWRMRGCLPGDCPRAEHAWFHTQVNLPCHPGLSDAQVEYLLSIVTAALDARPAAVRTGR
ncbi:DegT/DnrJ/EryC1/StrS family aminotransferase [Amycolatopsis pigmentata]|uniref:DegT/DnrJ/EryC1/StrS family aminotransferase n=1 Tax=Amycolatopsis pigmentata TaxID=450801 RepID=A0ABW5FPX3_9PSEU